MKHDVSYTDCGIFHEIVLLILNKHASLKIKHLRANSTTYVTKEFRTAVIKKSRLRKASLKSGLK